MKETKTRLLHIHGATIITPKDQIENGVVLIEDGLIQAIGTAKELPPPPGAGVMDVTGLTLVPGFIDLQCNGAFGCDFTSDPESIWDVAAQLPRFGVTAFLPTLVSSPLETIAAARAVLSRGSPNPKAGAIPMGLHLEGPFLNPQKKGAHNPHYLRPADTTVVRDWSPENGVCLVTLAPELPGALGVVRRLVSQGVVTSAGHSMATYEQALLAFEAGILCGTHLFNAMAPLGHRQPGLVGALLSDARPSVSLILDGIHVHPALIRLVWAVKGAGGLILVSDSTAASGMPPGKYRLGDQEMLVTECGARLPDGTLAGSVLPMAEAIRNLLTFTGCPLAEALPTVTKTPAALLGLSHQRGSLAPGMCADLVLLTPDLEIAHTLVAGEVVFSKPHFPKVEFSSSG
ncbi:MAG: N-acetylglucosamine-6-phosphate deacetylase [Anaerolineales bacterium]